jgi:hypothetical protein
MNLDLIVDQNHSYRQAVAIAYEKASRKGNVDAATVKECEMVLSEPEPDYVYHEALLDHDLQLYEDGSVSYRTLSPRDFYERVKLNARISAAEVLADQMDNIWQDVKATVVGVETELLSQLKFSVDEKGTIKPSMASGSLGVNDEKRLFDLLNNHSGFKNSAKGYVWVLAGVVGQTIEGLSAKYARHFASSK